MATLIASLPLVALSLRVGGTYKTIQGNDVTITDCDLNQDRGFYYIGDDGRTYRQDGSHADVDTSLCEMVNLDGVSYVQPELGQRYETERHDRVTIRTQSDQINGYPFRSDVGDFYNDRGERWNATPGSHLVKRIG